MQDATANIGGGGPTDANSAAIAAIVARALAGSRAFGDPEIAVGAVLSETLPALGVDFAMALGRDGRPIASAGAPKADRTHAAADSDALLSAGAAALADAAGALDADIAALPLKADDDTVGALVMQAEDPNERPDFAAGVRLLADCLAELLTARPDAVAEEAEDEDKGVAARLVQSLANHADGVALFGADTGLVMANRAFVQAHGAEFRDLQGLTLEDILRRNHHGYGPLLLARDVSHADGAGAEMALAADGGWLRISRRRSSSGDELVLQSAADDMLAGVSESRRRTHAAQAKAAEASRLWDGLAVGAILLSKTGRIVEANPEAARLLRTSQADLIGRRLGRLAENAGGRWAPVGRPKAGRRQLAAKARRLDDGRTLLALTALPEPRRPAAEENKARLALAGTQALGELAHEMRTPLNAVIGFADVMLARSFGPVNERQAQYLEDIGGAGRHMLQMVDNMLDHVQLASGRYPFEPEWADLALLCSEAMRMLETMAEEADVELLIVPMDDLEAFVDRRGMLQVLINLLTNAIKFTPAGGLVTLAATALADGLYISVSDTGEGIPKADLKRVTEPFTQARRMGGQPLKGAGLGLSIVSAIVALHDGEVEISSEVGEGTEIAIKLPKETVRLKPGAPA